MYLGTSTTNNDPTGNATFTFSGPALTVGHVVTSTATATNGTSEFSEAVTVLAAPTVQFDASNYLFGENVGTATISVMRTGDTSGTSTVDYTTVTGTATAGSDFTTTAGTLTFNPGVVVRTIDVPVANDNSDEPNETFTITLANPTGATLGAPATTTRRPRSRFPTSCSPKAMPAPRTSTSSCRSPWRARSPSPSIT